MASTEPGIQLSVIVPLYNEEESVGLLYEQITAAVEPIGIPYEILFVNDGSRDATLERTRELCARDSRLKVISFRRNFGQTPAMAAGIEYATGDILVTMDGDLQNDPSDIPNFLDKIAEGYDIVVGWRHRRQDKLITRKIPSKIANWLIGKVTGVPIKDNGCSLKAYRADVIKAVPLYSEMHRFIPAMTSLAGSRVAEIKVKHHARRFGTSKYGLSRVFRVLLDLFAIKTIIAFGARPLRWFATLALPSFFISTLALIAAAVTIASDDQGIVFAGIGVLFGALTFFLVLSGAVAELIYKTGELRLENLSTLTTVIDRSPRVVTPGLTPPRKA
jgi:glycosyltransferase involved in cell wall biosynthesis